MKLLGITVAWAWMLLAAVAVPVELREPDVLYFDQNLPEKVILTLEKSAKVYLDKDFQTLAAALPAGTKVQIIGLGDLGNYLISTQYRGTRIEGWMPADTLPPVDPKLIDAAKQAQAKRNAIERAIKEKRAIQGMSLDEVRKAMGKPERTSSRQEAQSRLDTWTYITYEQVPQTSYVADPWGRVTLQTIYIKKPVGELSIEFNNGFVVSIEEHRRASRTTDGVIVLPNQ